MHSLIFLLAQKTQRVFLTRVIHTIIDQNWDLKGFKQVVEKIMEMLGLGPNEQTELFDLYIEKVID